MSNTFARSDSSLEVRRSNRRVANPCEFNAFATAVLRGLKRLEPLPWANTTMAHASSGMRNVPGSPTGGMLTSNSPLLSTVLG